MTENMPDILARIVERKRVEVAAKERFRASFEQSARYQSAQRRDFARALRAKPPAIIAEIKKASPSKGLLMPDFNPAAQAQRYFAGGAAALSVLTDRDFFQGSLSDFKTARASAFLPVIRKDFTIADIDILEAAASGADAILLIAAILTRDELLNFRAFAERYSMAALVEVHNEDELAKALDSGASIIGVNNRNLRTFDVNLETSERLASLMPADITKVAESGIHSGADVRRLQAVGFHAFLVGEHLMKSADPAEALRALRS